jgi:hypothetical protein
VIPFSIKVPIRSEVVFPAGAMFMGVEAATDFEKRGQADDQTRDKETGERVWLVTVVDMEEPDEERKFRATVELKVRLVAPHRPVPPVSRVPGYPPMVAFEGLSMTPWLDSQKCRAARPGESHRCRARLGYSLRATGMVEFAEEAAPAA